MELSKIYLVGAISLLFLSLTTSDRLTSYDIKKLVPLGSSGVESNDPLFSMKHSSSLISNDFGLNYEIKWLVPSGPNPDHNSLDPGHVLVRSKDYGFSHGIKRFVPSADPIPTMTRLKDYYSNRDIKRLVLSGPNHDHSPDSVPIGAWSTNDYGSNRDVKRLVPSSPNHKHSPHPIVIETRSKEYGFSHNIKRLVPSGPNRAESPDPVPAM